jgi:hypothetical protein
MPTETGLIVTGLLPRSLDEHATNNILDNMTLMTVQRGKETYSGVYNNRATGDCNG